MSSETRLKPDFETRCRLGQVDEYETVTAAQQTQGRRAGDQGGPLCCWQQGQSWLNTAECTAEMGKREEVGNVALRPRAEEEARSEYTDVDSGRGCLMPLT